MRDSKKKSSVCGSTLNMTGVSRLSAITRGDGNRHAIRKPLVSPAMSEKPYRLIQNPGMTAHAISQRLMKENIENDRRNLKCSPGRYA